MIKLYVEGPNRNFAPSAPKLRGIPFAYAHGILEHKADYDIIAEPINKHFDKRRVINGEECIAVLPDGEEIESMFFFWHSRHEYINKGWRWEHKQVYYRPHGLLVAKCDKHSVEYAKRCVETRQSHI